MKKLIFAILALNALLGTAQDKEIDFSELQVPTTPAFSILGINPTEVSRPKSYKELETQFVNSFSGENGLVLPSNFAMEFQPYWMTPKRRLTYEKYEKRWFHLWRTASFSVAAAELPGFEDSTITNKRIGFGGRAYILEGSLTRNADSVAHYALLVDRLQKVSLKLQNALSEMRGDSLLKPFASDKSVLKGKLDRILDKMKKDYERDWTSKEVEKMKDQGNFNVVKGFSPTEQEIWNTWSTKLQDTLKSREEGYNVDAAREEITFLKQVADYLIGKTAKLPAKGLERTGHDREGWFIEAATALLVDFPSNDINLSYTKKYAGWITGAYRVVGLHDNTVDFVAMLRLMRNEIPNIPSTNKDLGLKVAWDHKKLTLSSEFIFRWQKATISRVTDPVTNITDTRSINSDDYKLVLNVEYKLSEKLMLTYSFGKGLQLNTEVGGNLVSLAGLNFGLGGLTSKSFKH